MRRDNELSAAHRDDAHGLALWGEADGVYDISGLATLVALYPGMQAQRVARTGHLPMVEHPDDTARSYLEFLR